MYLAYKFRMYPNKEQQIIIDKILTSSIFVYNHYLKAYEKNSKLSPIDCIKDYKKNLKTQYPYFHEIEDYIIISQIYKLFANIKREAKDYKRLPKYKKKYHKNSFVIKNQYNTITKSNLIKINLKNHNVTVNNILNIPIKGYNKLEHINGKIINAIILKDSNSKYYISIQCELEPKEQKLNPKSIVGIDMGINTLLTLSDGTTYANKRYIKEYENRINRQQKALTRKNKGSKNYIKNKEKLTKVYSKLKNARKLYIHQITKEIVEKYDIIVCETLNVKHMIMDKTCTRSIVDATFTEIIRQLKYKSQKYGKYFYQVPKYYPSSQICCVCNNKASQYKDLSLRIYKCNKCGNEVDRDLNASINIMNEGLKIHKIKTNFI